jgi:hypothetical protein
MSDKKIYLPNSDITLTLRIPTPEEMLERHKQEREYHYHMLRAYAAANWDNSDIDHTVLEWTGDYLTLTLLEQCFTKQDALAWLTEEIRMALGDGRDVSDYLTMLAHGPDHPVLVHMSSDNRITVGDGWHRIAIAIIRQTPIKAVIGRDKKETP